MLSRADFCVMGVGELVVDHVFSRHRGRQGPVDSYLFSRGGGSIGNILGNLAHGGVKCTIFAVGGQDAASKLAIADLAQLGVDVSKIRYDSGATAINVFQYVEDRGGLLPEEKAHFFSLNCPCHSDRDLPPLSTHTRSRSLATTVVRSLGDFHALCVDRINNRNTELAQRGRSKGILSFLDLGRTSSLRYRPAAKIAQDIGSFDLCLMPNRVWRSVVKRCLPGVRLDDSTVVVRRLRGLGVENVVIVSDGNYPIQVFDLRNKPSDIWVWQADAFRGEVLESSGAGDLLLACIILQLVDLGVRSWDTFCRLGPPALASIVRKATEELRPVLQTIGARGHLPRVLSENNPWYEFEEKDIGTICRDKPGDLCPFIAQQNAGPIAAKRGPAPTRNLTVGNVVSLADGLARLLEQNDAVQSSKAVIERGVEKVFVIGSGGSFAAALHVADCISAAGNGFAHAVFPFDYLTSVARIDTLVVVSYSGKTPDCAKAIEKAKRDGVPSIVLVTADFGSPLQGLLPAQSTVVAFAPRAKRERGFVSFIATVGPAAVWTAAATSFEEVLSVIKRHMTNSDAHRTLRAGTARFVKGLGLSRGSRLFLEAVGVRAARPALHDLESKFCEGDLGAVRIHEAKDFSHGRFMSVLSEGHANDPVALFTDGMENGGYLCSLRNVLAKNRGSRFLCLSTDETGILAGLDLLLQSQYLVRDVAQQIKIDIARPGSRVPEAGLRLYRWR